MSLHRMVSCGTTCRPFRIGSNIEFYEMHIGSNSALLHPFAATSHRFTVLLHQIAAMVHRFAAMLHLHGALPHCFAAILHRFAALPYCFAVPSLWMGVTAQTNTGSIELCKKAAHFPGQTTFFIAKSLLRLRGGGCGCLFIEFPQLVNNGL